MAERVTSGCVACDHPAGSLERLQAYRARVEAGKPIFHPGDAKAVLTSTADLDAKRVLMEADKLDRRNCA
jgi:hypothetical protein